jgi:hypothetical protein
MVNVVDSSEVFAWRGGDLKPGWLMAAGLVVLWFLIHRDGSDVTTLAPAPGLFIAGLGGGLALAPLFDVILSSVEDHEVGSGSGVLNAMQRFGGSIGIALLGTIFFSLLASHIGEVATSRRPTMQRQIAAIADGHGAVARSADIVTGYANCQRD